MADQSNPNEAIADRINGEASVGKKCTNPKLPCHKAPPSKTTLAAKFTALRRFTRHSKPAKKIKAPTIPR